MSYWRFAAMIATSTVVMFGLMYLNTYLLTHVFWSETRAYMALLMGATMAIIMLAFMLSMYSSKTVNAAIFSGAVVVFAASPFDRDHDIEPRRYLGSARAQARGRDHLCAR